MRVLVTGANGFVGRAVCRTLRRNGAAVRMAFRSPESAQAQKSEISSDTDFVVVGDVEEQPAWDRALDKVDAVIHLAARVHVMHDQSADPLAAFRSVNVGGTERLARASAKAGVKRFVFVSSIKVNGEQTFAKSFTENDPPDPKDPYGQSKWEAERGLRQISGETGLETVIVRPPLVYGPGVRANFLQLVRWIDRGLPLPLRNARNRRSMVGVENLADFLTRCVTHDQAPNQTFLISDGEDVSTAELARRIGRALGRGARLLPVPEAAMRAAAKMFGREPQVDRLLGSLEVSSRKAQALLSWKPPLTLDDGLAATARWYLGRSRGSAASPHPA